VLTARWLSPAGRGEYFFVVTLAQTLVQFGSFGLQSSNTYFVARDRSLAGPLLANSIWAAVVTGGVGSVGVLLALRGFGGRAEGAGVWLVALLATATLFYLLGTNLLVGLKRIAAFNLFQLVSNYGVLVCLAVAAALGAGAAGFVAASAIGWTLVSAVLLWVLRRGSGASLRFAPDVFRTGFRYASKAYLVTLCGFIVVRTNVFLLTALQGTAQVGYYSVASQIADVMGILPQSMALILFPTLVMATEGRMRATVTNAGVVAVLLGVGCAMVALLAQPFIVLVFGVKFAPTVPVLRWMMPGAFFLGLTCVFSQYLAAAGFPLSLVAAWIGGTALALGLGLLFIPQHSAVGAAIALSITHFVVFAAVLGLSIRLARSRAAAVRLAAQGADRS